MKKPTGVPFGASTAGKKFTSLCKSKFTECVLICALTVLCNDFKFYKAGEARIVNAEQLRVERVLD